MKIITKGKVVSRLFVALVLLGVGVSAVGARRITPRKGMNVAGRVCVDGKPRKGVVVSDGINVVVTDRHGEYQMSSCGRQHVFVSVPSDCEMPVSDGMPAFYSEISDTVALNRVDFNLKGAPVKRRWKLLAVADPQIGPQDTLEYSGIVVPQIADYAATLGPDVYGIMLGDLVWNSPGLYGEYVKQAKRIGVPVFSVIGNHDHNEKVHGDVESDREFRDAVGPTYYSVNIGDCHLVVLDDVLYSGVKNRNDYAGRLTEAQLDWLRRDLEHVGHDKTVIVGLHIPTSRRNAKGHISNNKELYELLAPFRNAQILSGHTHYQFTTTIAPNITETTLGAAMGAFWYPVCGDGSPRGFAVLEFDGARLVDKYYIGAGLPRGYQMKIYPPADAMLWNPDGEPVDNYDKVLINIFCWHTDWDVQVSEDDGPYSTLPDSARLVPGVSAARCWDPDVRKCLVDGRIPANHYGAKPTDRNDHMFLYTPSAGWEKLKVKALDPYGNIYVDSLSATGG